MEREIIVILLWQHMKTCLFCWFVDRITQKLPNKFPRNLYGRWVPAQNRAHEFLVQIREFFLNFLNIERSFNVFIHFSRNAAWTMMTESGILRWLVSVVFDAVSN